MIRAVLFVFMGGLVLQLPVTQHFIVEMSCQRLDYPEDVCADLSKHPDAEDAVQAEASRIMTWQSVFCDIPGAIASLILGAQSDKIGRKRVMMLPVIGVLLLNAILFTGSMMHSASLLTLLCSSVALGVSGGIGTFMTAVINYITDSTPEEQRTEALSKNLPFLGLGVVVGLLSSGVLTQQLGAPAVYFIGLVLMIIVIYIITFHLKESSPNAEKVGDPSEISSQSEPSGVLATIWDNLTAGVKVYTSEKNGFVKIQLTVLMMSNMINMAIGIGEANLIMLYTKKAPFSWSPSMYGIFMALKNALGIVGQAVGTGVFFKVMGEQSLRNDFILLQMGSLAIAVACAITATASSTTMLMMTSVLVIFATPGQSAGGSITSKLVSPAHKGAFMSLGTFLNTLAVPGAGFILNSVYSASVQTYPGFVFICMSSMQFAALAALTYVVMFTMGDRVKDEKKTE